MLCKWVSKQEDCLWKELNLKQVCIWLSIMCGSGCLNFIMDLPGSKPSSQLCLSVKDKKVMKNKKIKIRETIVKPIMKVKMSTKINRARKNNKNENYKIIDLYWKFD